MYKCRYIDARQYSGLCPGAPTMPEIDGITEAALDVFVAVSGRCSSDGEHTLCRDTRVGREDVDIRREEDKTTRNGREMIFVKRPIRKGGMGKKRDGLGRMGTGLEWRKAGRRREGDWFGKLETAVGEQQDYRHVTVIKAFGNG
ncbi:hypothetical protein SERLA73DRAFT_161156 [Serpula lacrymans var. lacrymans S7.3]|uniref:Uncharacterized protein n=1 Tax=Serpula lacrymans var. lacrymans (strain S7.3) TaxID=936435 RepID=F8PZL7_SERL3|nr:hypothetical protein SERLA73DRAFT_161156 [Serpula lacrymans var. lacrymans S7.3]